MCAGSWISLTWCSQMPLLMLGCFLLLTGAAGSCRTWTLLECGLVSNVGWVLRLYKPKVRELLLKSWTYQSMGQLLPSRWWTCLLSYAGGSSPWTRPWALLGQHGLSSFVAPPKLEWIGNCSWVLQLFTWMRLLDLKALCKPWHSQAGPCCFHHYIFSMKNKICNVCMALQTLRCVRPHLNSVGPFFHIWCGCPILFLDHLIHCSRCFFFFSWPTLPKSQK